jgi:hypothetical protein
MKSGGLGGALDALLLLHIARPAFTNSAFIHISALLILTLRSYYIIKTCLNKHNY